MLIELTDRKRTQIFINIMISGIVVSMLATSMTTALPPVVEYFGISISVGQWMTSGYSLIVGMIMPLTAFLIKKIPTKKLYLTGILCFIIGEFISIFAGDFAVMMIGRMFQACGNGVIMAMTQVIILSIYPVEKRGTMMGWYGMAATGAPVLAPTAAGILVDTVGWKFIFIFTAAIMIISFLMAVIVFEDVLERQDTKFDMISFAESIFAFGGITLGIGNISSAGLFSITAGLPLCIGIVVSILFVHRQMHLEKAFLDVRILQYKEYAVSVMASMLLYLVLMGGSVLMPIYVQSVMGYSAMVSGLVTLPGSVATALVSPFAGKIYDKMGIKKLFVTGSSLLLCSSAAMYFISMDTPLWVAASFNVVRNISIGCLMMPLMTWGINHIDKMKMADATSLLSSLRTVAGSIGAAVSVGVMTSISANSVVKYGASASMHGLNMAFAFMAVGAGIMFLLSVFAVRGYKKL